MISLNLAMSIKILNYPQRRYPLKGSFNPQNKTPSLKPRYSGYENLEAIVRMLNAAKIHKTFSKFKSSNGFS